MCTTNKKRLRKQLCEEISALNPAYLDSSSVDIAAKVFKLAELDSAPTVFFYYSVGLEVDTHRLMDCCLRQGKTVALPVVYGGGSMEFARYKGEKSSLFQGKLSIPQPGSEAARISPGPGDVIIVPALCYDRLGYRLGLGGGYYDRFLFRRAGFSIGLCRGKMLKESLPREDHDIPVKCVVTENAVIRLE